MIENYSFGSIIVNGGKYDHDLVLAGEASSVWWRATSHEVGINDLDPILVFKPKTIIFGTGAFGFMKVLPETEEYLQQQGVKVVILKTADAVNEYNNHISETGVVGAFHLTC